jgi:3-oxoacyl-[acyl-carrier protein] reductase
MAGAERVALVSGGSRGIGRAIALGLAADGMDVAVNYRRDAEAAAATVADIEALGRRAIAYQASVDDAEADRAMVEAVLEDLGGIDVLVNNAGLASRGHKVTDTDPDEVQRLLATHAIGAHHLCRLAVPSMRERGGGSVVMISSTATRNWASHHGPYTMAKVALEALALTLAKEEVRHGIRVNIVAPGLVDTDMGKRLVKGAMGVEDIRTLDATMPLGHVCRPEDVADVVRFLASDAARYVTGQRVFVDGGAG